MYMTPLPLVELSFCFTDNLLRLDKYYTAMEAVELGWAHKIKNNILPAVLNPVRPFEMPNRY